MHKWIVAVAAIVWLWQSVPLMCVAQETVLEVSSSAGAAVLYEPSTGRVLYEKNAHTKRPMASTTKLMTALVAVERLAPDARLTASAEALAVEGTSMGLRAGDTVSRDDLLYGLLLSSGNDAANVLALSTAPTLEAFATLMNEKADALGMTASQFVTPSGLDADGHGASAYDMALLAAAVLKDPLLASICACRQATVTVSDRQVTLTNHNRLLSSYPDAIGMKTGYTSAAGRCLVSAAKRDGVTLIAVTLHCANDWEEHTTLLDEGFSLLEEVTLEPPTLKPTAVFGGTVARVGTAASAVHTMVLSGDKAHIETDVYCPPYVWAPLESGARVGTVTYRLRGAVIAEVPITVTSRVEAMPPLSWSARVAMLFRRLLYEVITSSE